MGLTIAEKTRNKGFGPRIRALLASNPTMTDREIAKEVGCQYPYVYTLRRRYTTRLERNERRDNPVKPEKFNISEFNMLDEAGRAAAIAKLASSGDRQELQLAAIKALEELQRAKGQGVGPPPPSTTLEAVERLVLVGRAAGREVLDIAINQWEADRETPAEPTPDGEPITESLEIANMQAEGGPA